MAELILYWKGLSSHRKSLWLIASAIIVMGLGLSVWRFFFGLGAVTNLSDEFPWGFWIGFDVMGGVALAAGGFTLCLLVYIFGYHQYHSIVRPTVLTAFLGYLLVAIGLLYDLGKFYNIWHPLVMWNPHSVMFEVAWCVMLYLTVLFLEFVPIVLEKFNLQTPLKLLRRLSIPIVLAGVLLSVLHQSSLGSLFLIVPNKLHNLWYTPILPLLFFLSAITVGPAMVIVESFFSARIFRRGLETAVLYDLARFMQVGMLVYVAVKIQDLFVRGVWDQVFAFDAESIHFLIEMAILFTAMIMIAIRKVRACPAGLLTAAGLVVSGVVYNRFNVSWAGMLEGTGASYFPSWQEVGISLFLVTCGIVAFVTISKFFPVFPELEEPSREEWDVMCPAGKKLLGDRESDPEETRKAS